MSVVHLKREPFDVRIDRQSQWGNPFVMKSEEDRAWVIELYRHHLWHQIHEGDVTLHDLASLHGKTLGCWCAPKPCHGDVLVEASAWAKAQLEQ